MIVRTEEQFNVAMECLESSDEVAVDTETSGLNTRNRVDYLMGFCFSTDDLACYMPFRHREGNLPLRFLDRIASLLQGKDLIWHNQKFDWHSIKTVGIDPLSFTGKQYDTLILAQLVNEELYSKELDALGKKYLGEGKADKDMVKKFGELFGFDAVPVDMYERYGPQDAILTRRLKERLWRDIVAQELEAVYWDTEQPFCRLLYKMEQRGVGVDQDRAERKARIGRGRMATIARELGFNPSSPIALGKYLIDELGLPALAYTEKGRPSFTKAVMEDYDDILSQRSDKSALRVNEYRGWQKAVTSLYEPILEKVGPDGLIRTQFKQHGARTGRLSASDPNLQQVPRTSKKAWNGDAKKCFNAGREGFELVGWDYSQLELRIAAAYGEEAILLEEFAKEEADPFSALAPKIFGVLTPETRQETKTFVYANLYGAGLKKIAAQLGRPLEETKELYANYHSTIPGIMAVSQRVTEAVERRGWIRYWDGRRRHIRDRREAYKAWNSVCQGGGAQLVKKAMLRCEEFEDTNFQLVLQVHDEITAVVAEGMVDKYEPMVKEAMCDFPEFGVKFAVEGKAW